MEVCGWGFVIHEKQRNHSKVRAYWWYMCFFFEAPSPRAFFSAHAAIRRCPSLCRSTHPGYSSSNVRRAENDRLLPVDDAMRREQAVNTRAKLVMVVLTVITRCLWWCLPRVGETDPTLRRVCVCCAAAATREGSKRHQSILAKIDSRFHFLPKQRLTCL